MKKLFALLMATTMLSLVGCSLIDIPLPGTGNEQEEEQGNEQTGSEIPEEPLTSGPATVAITRATATTARFEGSIINDEVDLDFVQIIVRYAEPENFSAMSEDIPSVVVTRPDFDAEKKFSFRLEDLRHNTTYKFCAIVQYKNEVFYSDVQEFKTAGVGVTLQVKEGSVTDNSVELIGKVGGISPEDEGKFEMGLFYSPDKSLVEKGEGEKVVFDNIAEDGSVSVLLSGLYMDGPTYYFSSYVQQGDDCVVSKAGSFEIIREEVRRVKKIVRNEELADVKLHCEYEFEYDANGNVVASTFKDEEEDYVYEYRITYDYSSKGVVSIEEKEYSDGELNDEQTSTVTFADNGNIATYDYTWADGGPDGNEIYNYNAKFDYTSDGFLREWSVSRNGNNEWTLQYDCSDGRLKRISYWNAEWPDETDTYNTNDSFGGARELKNTSFDLNKALIPYVYPDDCLLSYGALRMGTLGKYYFGRMMVESCWNVNDYYNYGTTTDANYKDVMTYSTYEFEGFNDDFGTLPITSVSYDKEGYPTEFIVDVRGREVKITITLGAGNVVWEDEYEGVTYYEVVEVDRQETSGSLASIGKASVVVEYCE